MRLDVARLNHIKMPDTQTQQIEKLFSIIVIISRSKPQKSHNTPICVPM